jgi:NitT/TauT family transport system substrate-binding protein
MRRVDFGVGNADQILMAREQKAPVVAVMAAMQNSPRCIMVRKDSGIQRIADLKDVTLALGAGKAFVRYLEDKGLLKDVQVVPYTGSIALFLNEPRFAQQAYVFSEPFVAQQKGVEPHCMLVSDLGFNPYSSCLMMHEQRLADDKVLAAKMVKAVRRGWRAYLRNPEPVNRLINRDNPEMDLDSLRFAVDAIRPLCLGGEINEDSIGTMSDERWQTLASQLVDVGLLESAEPSRDAYTLQFLNELTPE